MLDSQGELLEGSPIVSNRGQWLPEESSETPVAGFGADEDEVHR
jgi:hypothetical protein